MEKRSNPAVRPNFDDLRFSVWMFHEPEVQILSDRAFRGLFNLISAYAGTLVGSMYSDGPRPGIDAADETRIARRAGLSPRQWAKVRDDILSFFVKKGGRYHLDRDWIEIAGRGRAAIPSDVQDELRSREGLACTYCGTDQGPFDIDHILPVARGGSNDRSNLTIACAPCNRSKGAKTLKEWRG